MPEWVDIEQLRTRIGLQPDDASRDAELEQAAGTALVLAEGWLDRRLMFKADEQETFTHYPSSGILLRRWPVEGHLTITPAGIGAAVSHYVIDAERGILHVRQACGPLGVSYSGGFHELPADLLQGLLLTFDAAWVAFAGFASPTPPVLNDGIRRVAVTGVGAIDYTDGIYGRLSAERVTALGIIPAVASGLMANYRRESRLGAG